MLSEYEGRPDGFDLISMLGRRVGRRNNDAVMLRRVYMIKHDQDGRTMVRSRSQFCRWGSNDSGALG